MRGSRPKIRQRINRTGTTSWCVDTGYINKRRIRRFFKTKQEAANYADQVGIARRNQGLSAFSLSDAQRHEAVEAFAQLEPVGATLGEVVKYYLEHVRPKGSSRALAVISAELVETKRKKGFKPRYVKALRVSFNVFNRTFGTRMVNTISHTEIDRWLDEQPYTHTTKRNYLRDLGILFRHAMDQEDCSENVVAKIERPIADDPLPSILNVESISRLLSVANENPKQDLLAGLAIGFFAGLRSCELEKLTWDEIHLEELLIEVKAEKSKTRKRRLVDVSPNLGSWIQLQPRQTGLVLPANWRRRLNGLLSDAEIKKWPKNCMRHCYASYHLAQHKSAALTALQLGHADTNMLFSHYRELVRPAEAARYWEIMPVSQPANVIP